jgi:Inner membrane component of T3SS, cytoplasmic domain
MARNDNTGPLKITLDDIANVAIPEAAIILPAPPPTGAKSYGTINQAADQFVAVEERGSILLQGWFYLGMAGLVGALAGWAIAEPGFVDGRSGSERWGNLVLLPLIITLICFAFAMAESAVERSLHKAVLRGVLALPLGLILGFFFEFAANIIYSIGLNICYAAGAQTYRNPAVWIARGIAWMVFGAAGGLIYGIIGQSMKKGYYGVIGGVIGAGLGGILFDPIAIFTNGGAPSRAIGFALFGIATGVGMGLVESALKDRWLYVMAGPLAGKQFILYKSLTTIGSRQQSDIYLFKDPNILPEHAAIQITGARVQLRATGPVSWAGQNVTTRVLQDGDLLQIGRYSFRYKEKHRP